MKKAIFTLLATSLITSCAQDEILDEIITEEFSHQTITEELSPTAITNSYGRELYDFEKEDLLKVFPGLTNEINDVRVFCEPTSNMNCIGYAMGLGQWVELPFCSLERLSIFKQLFLNPESFGYFPSDKFALCETYGDNAIVDGWGISEQQMTHASRRASGNTWASKLGPDIGITHSRPALESNAYGNILVSFTFDFMAMSNLTKENIDTRIAILSKEEKSKLIKKTYSVDPKIQERFEFLHNEWYESAKNTPEIKYSSFMLSRVNLPQFDELVSMGEPIIPLIIEKLTHEEYFFTQLVYEAIRKNANKMLMPSYDENGKILIESAQVKAMKYVKNWIEYDS